MLTTAGFDTDTAVGGLTAFSLLEVCGLLALPPAPPGLFELIRWRLRRPSPAAYDRHPGLAT